MPWCCRLECRAGPHEVKVDVDFAVAKCVTEDLAAELRREMSEEGRRGLALWRGVVNGRPRSGKRRDGGQIGRAFRLL